MYEISTWFIAMWNRKETLDKIEIDSLKAKIQFMELKDEHVMYYDRQGLPGVIDLRHHITKMESVGDPNEAQVYHTTILKAIIDPRTDPNQPFENEQKWVLMDWAYWSVLVEKEIINVALRENHLLRKEVARLSGLIRKGEEDVGCKRPKVAPAGSDDSTGHTDQDGEGSTKDDSCANM